MKLVRLEADDPGRRPRWLPWALRLWDSPRLKVNLQLELRDAWVGFFWWRTELYLHVFICVVPCLPIHVTRLRGHY